MMEYVFVAIGGMLGSLARFTIGRKITEKTNADFPVGTFLINMTGTFLLGIISSLGWSGNQLALFGDGFLGAYTTFSTFMYDGFNLFKNNQKKNAISYISISLVLGIAGFIAGIESARLLKLF